MVTGEATNAIGGTRNWDGFTPAIAKGFVEQARHTPESDRSELPGDAAA
jgi:hypothetical protein